MSQTKAKALKKEYVARSEAYDLIRRLAGGTFFTATFVKRTDGALRKMNCRLEVKKDLKGGSQGFDPKKQDLLTVWDRGNRAYRMINLAKLIDVTIKGTQYLFYDA